jgi:hypothetical protein
VEGNVIQGNVIKGNVTKGNVIKGNVPFISLRITYSTWLGLGSLGF